MKRNSFLLKLFYFVFGSITAFRFINFVIDAGTFWFYPELTVTWPNTTVFTNPVSFIYRLFYNLGPLILLLLTPTIAKRKPKDR